MKNELEKLEKWVSAQPKGLQNLIISAICFGCFVMALVVVVGLSVAIIKMFGVLVFFGLVVAISIFGWIYAIVADL